ncbi:hypothetical protein FPS14_contig00055-0005 [Flavobacterium psychrophilum]|nr:hypothetical protein FPS14_contig00055-0005 [Flavobacterium psychrophilum]
MGKFYFNNRKRSSYSLGQVRVNDKSNEITAIPKLLDKLMIKGNIITIDAMGTQTNIVDKIIKNEADYIFSAQRQSKTTFRRNKR